MSHYIAATNISTGWLEAMEHLRTRGGKESNLVVAIAPSEDIVENQRIRRVFDSFVQVHESPRVRRIRKVADTIFPSDFYKPSLGGKARDHLYKMQRLARKIESRFMPGGTYFDRLIDWPQADKEPINQLESKVQRMKKQWQESIRNGNAYELALSDVEDDATVDDALRIQNPTRDKSIMGFPCLSHISLTLFEGRLDLTALYRNQHFVTKAYGNYVGLSELQHFISREVGCVPGELVCVATHADAEFAGEVGKRNICRLIDECRDAISTTTQ